MRPCRTPRSQSVVETGPSRRETRSSQRERAYGKPVNIITTVKVKNKQGFVESRFKELTRFVFLCLCVRTLCDKLRRERDRAVSDLADALRNLDDLRKQKNDAVRELKELK